MRHGTGIFLKEVGAKVTSGILEIFHLKTENIIWIRHSDMFRQKNADFSWKILLDSQNL